eukprot:UN17143
MELYSGSADFTNRLSQFTTDNDYVTFSSDFQKQYRNIELFKESSLPLGAVHLLRHRKDRL